MAVMVCVFLDRAIRCGNDSGDSIYDERDLLVLLDKNSFILVPQSYKRYIVLCSVCRVVHINP